MKIQIYSKFYAQKMATRIFATSVDQMVGQNDNFEDFLQSYGGFFFSIATSPKTILYESTNMHTLRGFCCNYSIVYV